MPIDRERVWEESPKIRRELEKCHFIVRKRPYHAVWDVQLGQRKFIVWFLDNQWHFDTESGKPYQKDNKATLILKNIIHKANNGQYAKSNSGATKRSPYFSTNTRRYRVSHHHRSADRGTSAPQ